MPSVTTESSRQGIYLLSRDSSESQRLEIQHDYVVKFVLDNKLIFDDSVQIPSNGKVLDAGAGTGIWLLALAQQVPKTVSLFGIDISSAQFPREATSQNVHFEVMQIVDLSSSWTSQFDFVQQRFLVAGLPAKDWPVALSNYFRILKPGGSIQLLEPYPRARVAGGLVGKRIVDLQETLYSRQGLMFDCAERIPDLLKEAGFRRVHAHKKVGPVGDALGEDGQRGKRVSAGAMRAMGKAMAESGVVSSLAEIETLIEEQETEWEETGGFYMTYWVFTAVKPCEEQ